ASLVDHLTPLGVAARVAWETYPLGFSFLGLLFLAFAFLRIARHVAQRTLTPALALGKWPKRAAVAALAALYALGIYGKWSWYPWGRSPHSSRGFSATRSTPRRISTRSRRRGCCSRISSYRRSRRPDRCSP